MVFHDFMCPYHLIHLLPPDFSGVKHGDQVFRPFFSDIKVLYGHFKIRV